MLSASGAVEIDRVGHAAHGQVLNVRSLRAQHADDLQCLALIFQRLHVVRERQAGSRRAKAASPDVPNSHSRRCPAARWRRRRSRDPARPSAHCANCASRAKDSRPASTSAAGSAFGICITSTQSSADKLIEVHDVIVQRMRDQNQVADILRIQRDLQVQRVFHRTHAGHGMHRGAHAAEALGEEPGIARIAARAESSRCRATWCRTPRHCSRRCCRPPRRCGGGLRCG